MKVGKQFNTLTYGEYLHLIANYKKFTDFNTLGLFRSLVETTKLSLEQKLELRKVAVAAFPKTFEFLQLKDPTTYFEVSTLGKTLTKADENQAWNDIRQNQQKIWESKRLGHRNFGIYSKHVCGYENCHLQGLMLKAGSYFTYDDMHFHTDASGYSSEIKSKRRRQDRKAAREMVSRRRAEE
ncbi:MAG: hypothetical protein H7Z21_08345 [Hymenobacter sp.]|nr:hypothetical protein [Hymenobacter sp.]